MSAVSRSSGSRTARIVFVCLFLSAFGAFTSSGHAETWGELYHGPWTEYWTGTTFYGTLHTSDGGYLLTGTSNNRGVILKVASNGALQWSKLVQGNGYQRESSMIGAVEASNGDFIVTGQVSLAQPINPGATGTSWDIYIIRLTSVGDVLWEKIYARKNVGSAPDTHEFPQYIYKSYPAGKYVVTGSVLYSGVPGCPYSGYRASQALVVNDSGVVQNDFLMAGPSASGDGAVKTYYTSDGNYLVLTEQFYNTGLYTTGLQKYGPTGSLLWSKAYHEVYHKPDGDHLLKISAGAVAETADGYVVFGSTYYNVAPDPALGAYYHFKVDKATGSIVAWNKKFRAWPNWNSLWVLNADKTPDGGLVATIGDGASSANDRIFKTLQSSGDLLWVNEYGANLGTVTPWSSELVVTANAFDAVLAKLTIDGHMDASCKAIPITDKTNEATPHNVLRTDVRSSYSQSDCNTGVGRVAAYAVSLTEAGAYHEANSCSPHPELTVSRGGNFGTVNVGSSGSDIQIGLSNSNGLSNLVLTNVSLSDTTNFKIVSNSCSNLTLYPVNIGTPTSCSATIRFAPLSNGAKQCSVTFASNYSPPIRTTLIGTGAGAVLPTVTISATDSGASEQAANTGRFKFTRTGSTARALTARYTVSGTATPGKDYRALSGSVVIPAGAAFQTVTVVPINDTVAEAAETVVATLASSAAYTIGSAKTATVRIGDNEKPVVSIRATDPAAAEPGTNVGVFTVSRIGSIAAALTVKYTVSGAATRATDYKALSGSVIIPAGASSALIKVIPVDNKIHEVAERVIVTLSANWAYILGLPKSAYVTIADNDP